MLLFRDGHLDEYLRTREQLLSEHVREQAEDYLLNVDLPQSQQYLVDRYRVEPLILHADQATATPEEQLIPAESFPPGFNVYSGKSYPRQVLTFHIPFSGEQQLLRLRPSRFSMHLPDAEVARQELLLSIVDFRGDPEAIRNEYESAVQHIQSWVENSHADVIEFNNRLGDTALASIEARRATILNRRAVADAIGVPIRRSEDVPKTFAVPRAATRVVVNKPRAAASRYAPEPTLEDAVYLQILEVIADAGQQMESHPSLHEGKDEEALRDALLLALVPNFHSVTGETFHKGGKTDILIRHEGKTLFVAECLIWGGQANYLKKIDQALTYLTWRDSKAAIVVFSGNDKFQPVLDTVEGATPRHPCFVSRQANQAEGSFFYRFHLKDDDSRGVSLAVMCFDFH